MFNVNDYHIGKFWHLTIIHTAVRCECSDRRQSLDSFKDMPLDVAITVAVAEAGAGGCNGG